MEEELKDEMRKLKEELASVKEQLKEVAERRRTKRKGIHIDVGERVHDYVEGIMEGVAEGISGELERSILIGPHGVKIFRRKPEERIARVDPTKAASTMSALGNEHRIKILGELIFGGKYISELQETLSEIASSTLSSHLDVLQEAGLVVQEKVRGRYLITIPGRIAYKMTNRITKLLEKESI